MTWIRCLSLALALVVLGAGGVHAGEDDAKGADAKGADARAAVLTQFLEVLHARIEAQMGRAEVLREAGRLDEALKTYAELDALFEREMARITGILDRLAPGAEPTRLPTPPPVVRDEPAIPRVPRVPPSPGGAAEKAVERALAWLAAHQSPDGGWEAAGFQRWCRQQPAQSGPDGQGKAAYDVGVTGLAVLAYLRGGHTHLTDDAYAPVVGKGLLYLSRHQDAEGCLGSRKSQHFIYNHATAALALVTAYALTQDEQIRVSAQKALDFIALSRNPYFVWRYGVKPGDNDTSVTGWMIQTLAVARDLNQKAESAGLPAPFVVDEAAFDGARAWLDKMTEPEYGRVGYIQRGGAPARPQEQIDRFPGDKSESMTAVGIAIRVAIGEDPTKSRAIIKGTKLLSKVLPRWKDDGSIDMYYWYYGTYALAYVPGRHWRAWGKALVRTAIVAQRKDGGPCGYEGSWDPVGPWGPDGGRVYSTAIMALTLETVVRGAAPASR